MPHRVAKQIFTTVQRAAHVLLVPHQHPDGDALGSVTSFMQFLDRIGIRCSAFSSTPISPKLGFLAQSKKITQDESVVQDPSIDVVVVFDSGDLTYAGIEARLKDRAVRPFIINIDHHKTNRQFGDLNLVIPSAASTTEILYRFYTYNKISIDRRMATSLLTGLLTDTDNFTNAATTAASMAIASDLITKGGDINTIKLWVFQDKTVASLKLWGAILARLTKHDRHDVVYTYLTQDDLKTHGVADTDTEGIANFLNNISDGRVGVLLKEQVDGTVKASMRTTRAGTDVAKIAKHLGGGGHQKAAGFTVSGTIEQALEHIWNAIDLHGLDAVPADE